MEILNSVVNAASTEEIVELMNNEATSGSHGYSAEEIAAQHITHILDEEVQGFIESDHPSQEDINQFTESYTDVCLGSLEEAGADFDQDKVLQILKNS